MPLIANDHVKTIEKSYGYISFKLKKRCVRESYSFVNKLGMNPETYNTYVPDETDDNVKKRCRTKENHFTKARWFLNRK